MKIGDIAASANITVQAIRFYEREGLLRKPARTAGGYRSYEQKDLDQVNFIRACQGLGFSLREVRHLIRLHRVTALADHGATMAPETLGQILILAEQRISSIDDKLNALAKMRSDLQGVIDALSLPVAKCPRLSADDSPKNMTAS